MPENIIHRFNRVRAELEKPSFTVQAAVSEDGNIVFGAKRSCGILVPLFGVLIAATIVVLRLLHWNTLSGIDVFAFVVFPGVLGIVFLFVLIYAVVYPSATYLTIDPLLSQIVVYGNLSPLKWGILGTLRIEDIQLFLAYWWDPDYRAANETSVYIITNDNVAHFVFSTGTSPGPYSRVLGYVCQKMAVHVTEKSPELGPLSRKHPQSCYNKQRLDIKSIMNKGQILYDPRTDDYIQIRRSN